uniref:Uncharacterized protein n=1 Tax=Parascaris equorum TaxID=6256 RepID=A0A914RB33_PAREQ
MGQFFNQQFANTGHFPQEIIHRLCLNFVKALKRVINPVAELFFALSVLLPLLEQYTTIFLVRSTSKQRLENVMFFFNAGLNSEVQNSRQPG